MQKWDSPAKTQWWRIWIQIKRVFCLDFFLLCLAKRWRSVGNLWWPVKASRLFFCISIALSGVNGYCCHYWNNTNYSQIYPQLELHCCLKQYLWNAGLHIRGSMQMQTHHSYASKNNLSFGVGRGSSSMIHHGITRCPFSAILKMGPHAKPCKTYGIFINTANLFSYNLQDIHQKSPKALKLVWFVTWKANTVEGNTVSVYRPRSTYSASCHSAKQGHNTR